MFYNLLTMSTKQRCTHRQRDVLVEYMVANPEFARAEHTGPYSQPELDGEWLNLKEMLRDLGPDKSVLAWKRTWRELKKKARKSVKKSKSASRDESPMRDIDTKILSVIVHAPVNIKKESMAFSNSLSYLGNNFKETDSQVPPSDIQTDDFVDFFRKNGQLLKCGIIQFKLETDLKTERNSILRQQNELLKQFNNRTILCHCTGSRGNKREWVSRPINPALDVLKPHPNCNKYFQCRQGEVFERQCASNLVFNVHTQECEWAEHFDCENRVPAGPNSDSSEEASQPDNGGGNSDPSLAPEICSAEGSDGVLVAHENCNKFYECDNGVPVDHKCASTLQFNPSIGECDWPENVNCGDRNSDGGNGGSDEGGNGDPGSGGGSEESGNGGNSNPSEALEICAAEGSDSVLVAHENCHQFYMCSEGAPVAFKCWGNLLFNPAINQCDWPENVNCGDRNPDGGNGDGGNGKPSEAPKICAAEGSDGVLVAHENCHKFYKCSEGIPVAMSCWGNLLFNPANDQCDWPENVDCDDRNPEGGNHGGDGESHENGGNGDNKPGEAKEVCAAEGSDGVLVAHEKCNQFYKCDGGVPVAIRCGGILLYNAAIEQCDWPENVKCAEKIPDGGNGGEDEGNGEDGDKVSGGNSDPSKASEICAAEDSEGVLVANENCNQFYICNGGKPVAMNCWGDLIFNPATGECDWTDNVNCGSHNAFTSLNKHLLARSRVLFPTT